MTEQIPDESFAALSTRFSNLTEDFPPLTLQQLNTSLQEQEAQIFAAGAERGSIRPSRQYPSCLQATSTREAAPSTFIGSFGSLALGEVTLPTLTGSSSSPTPGEGLLGIAELRAVVRRDIGTNRIKMCLAGLDFYKDGKEHLEPLWKLLSHGVLICDEALQCEVLYTALMSHGNLQRERVATTWSGQIKLITQRAYKEIVRQKTAKDKRIWAIQSLEIIEKNLKWFVRFLKGYMGNANTVDGDEAMDTVRPPCKELDKIARWIDEFLKESAKLKEKALKAE
jgi:hypothetical protein